jgi:hypothetical protein
MPGQPSPAYVEIYWPGQMITMRATFCGTDLVTPADPSLAYFEIRDPWGAVSSYPYGTGSVVRSGVGAYFHDHQIPRVASAAGDWTYAGVATGLVEAAVEWSFRVASSGIL